MIQEKCWVWISIAFAKESPAFPALLSMYAKGGKFVESRENSPQSSLMHTKQTCSVVARTMEFELSTGRKKHTRTWGMVTRRQNWPTWANWAIRIVERQFFCKSHFLKLFATFIQQTFVMLLVDYLNYQANWGRIDDLYSLDVHFSLFLSYLPLRSPQLSRERHAVFFRLVDPEHINP